MLKMTGFDVLFQAAGWLYILATLAAMAFAVWVASRWWTKLIAAVSVFLIFAAYPYSVVRKEQETQRAQQERYARAEALFDERCKTAGEEIYRTVEGVEGVYLVDLRIASKSSDHDDPNWPDAALPREHVGTSYLASFLGWEQKASPLEPRSYINFKKTDFPGYQYVDARGDDGQIYRHTLPTTGNPFIELAKQPLVGAPARYAVSFVNTTDPTERAQWIAGTTVTIRDTQTNEVLATSTWYSLEAGFGSRAGARQPWLFASTCPKLKGWRERYPTRFFVDQVLKPNREGSQ
jgi:hypothetical protein